MSTTMAGYSGPIDLDRGVNIKQSFLSPTRVLMYKDNPGEYFDDNGTPVSDAVAAAAGFDVAALGRIKFLSDKKSQFQAEIDAELKKAAGNMLEEVVVSSETGFSMVHMGGNRYKIIDLDGTAISPRPLNRDDADRLFELLTQAEEA